MGYLLGFQAFEDAKDDQYDSQNTCRDVARIDGQYGEGCTSTKSKSGIDQNSTTLSWRRWKRVSASVSLAHM